MKHITQMIRSVSVVIDLNEILYNRCSSDSKYQGAIDEHPAYRLRPDHGVSAPARISKMRPALSGGLQSPEIYVPRPVLLSGASSLEARMWPRLSANGHGHKVYPYLLKGVAVDRPDQAWAADITYVRLAHGFVYLVAILDWYGRYVVSWELSTHHHRRNWFSAALAAAGPFSASLTLLSMSEACGTY